MADRAKSPEEPKVAKTDFFSSGEEDEPESDTGETKELVIADRTAVVSGTTSLCFIQKGKSAVYNW